MPDAGFSCEGGAPVKLEVIDNPTGSILDATTDDEESFVGYSGRRKVL